MAEIIAAISAFAAGLGTFLKNIMCTCSSKGCIELVTCGNFYSSCSCNESNCTCNQPQPESKPNAVEQAKT